MNDIDPLTVGALAPERIATAVLLRVSRLDPDAPALTRAVAVLGPQARLATCARLPGVDPRRAQALAADLVDLAVLAPGEPARFVHPVVRTAIYEDVSPAERSDLHARAARLLAELDAGPAAVAVHLLATAPRAITTSSCCCAMPRETHSRAAHPTPRVHCCGVRSRSRPMPPTDPWSYSSSGTPSTRSATRPRAGHLREAGETAADPVLRAHAVAGLAWTTHPDAQRQREQLPLYESSAAEVEPIDHELALELEAARLGALLLNPDLPTRFEEAAEHFRDLPALTGAECLLRSFVARRALTGGPVADAGDLAEQAAAHPALVSKGGHPLWRTNITICLVEAERYGVAEHLLSRAIRHAGQDRLAAMAGACAVVARPRSARRRGDLRAAEADALAALDIQSLTYSYNKYPQMVPLIDSLADQGRTDDGEALLAEHGMDGELSPSLFSVLPLLARGRLRATAGEHAHARADLEDALRRIELSRGLFPWANDARIALVPVLRHIGEDAAARSAADDALASATAMQSRRNIGGALRVLGHARGRRPGGGSPATGGGHLGRLARAAVARPGVRRSWGGPSARTPCRGGAAHAPRGHGTGAPVRGDPARRPCRRRTPGRGWTATTAGGQRRRGVDHE